MRRTTKNVFVNFSVFLCNICRSASDFIIGTVHKAKGLEFNTVMVSDDFIKLPLAGEPACYYYRPQFGESSLPGPVELQWNRKAANENRQQFVSIWEVALGNNTKILISLYVAFTHFPLFTMPHQNKT